MQASTITEHKLAPPVTTLAELRPAMAQTITNVWPAMLQSIAKFWAILLVPAWVVTTITQQVQRLVLPVYIHVWVAREQTHSAQPVIPLLCFETIAATHAHAWPVITTQAFQFVSHATPPAPHATAHPKATASAAPLLFKDHSTAPRVYVSMVTMISTTSALSATPTAWPA